MKKETLIDLAAYALVILFVYAGLNKWIAYDFYIKDLKRSPFLAPIAFPISILIPLLEFVISAMLLFPKTRLLGFIGSIILMGAFTVYVGSILSLTGERPCSCGGIIRNLTWPNHMLFNIAFLLIAITGFVFQKRNIKNTYA